MAYLVMACILMAPCGCGVYSYGVYTHATSRARCLGRLEPSLRKVGTFPSEHLCLIPLCVHKCVDMYVDICVDKCVDMCVDMRMDLCVDMCVGTCACDQPSSLSR